MVSTSSLVFRAVALSLVVQRSLSHKSLTPTGILAALVTGVIHASTESNLNLILLFAFYLTSSKLTKYKSKIKSQLTETVSDNKNHSQRGFKQVLCNSIFASFLILINSSVREEYRVITQIGIIVHYCAVNADSWSSELGILSKSNPILITTGKECPPGTNGGVSTAGLLAAIMGTNVIVVVSFFFLPRQLIGLKLFAFLLASGVFGSLFDSLLGALFQPSYINENGKILDTQDGSAVDVSKVQKIELFSGWYYLDNNSVNLLNSIVTPSFFMLLYSALFSSD